MSHNNRSPQRRRRIAVGLGTAAGALLAAALIPVASASLGPPPPSLDLDPFEDLGLTGGATGDQVLLSTTGGQEAAFFLDRLVDDGKLSVPPPPLPPSLDPFEDVFGTNSTTAFLDSLLPPILATPLDQLAGSVAATASAVTVAPPPDADPFEDLGLTGGARADVLLQDFDPHVAIVLDGLVDSHHISVPPLLPPPDLDPFEDVFGTNSTTAFLDSLLPPILATPLDQLADQLIAAGL